MNEHENFNYRATGWARRIGIELGMKSGERFLFLTIAGFYNDEQKKAFPSIETLEKMTGMGNTTVHTHLRSLEDRGVLVIDHVKSEGSKYTHNVYRFPDFKPTRKFQKAGTFSYQAPGRPQEAGYFT